MMNRGFDETELDRLRLADKNETPSSSHHPTASSSLHYLAVTLVALAVFTSVLLPANLLATQRFHHDEALYATWALQIVSGHDPWLTHTPIDKPPLFLYLLAGSMSLLGITETAARIPSLLATAGTVLLTFGLGRRCYGLKVGLTAAWLVALSPFTLLFAPTAFTDPLLVMFILAACLAASYGRASWAGVGLGLAIITKQQGLFFAPLVIGVLVIRNWSLVTNRNSHHKVTQSQAGGFLKSHLLIFGNFLLALLLTLLPLLIWNFNRTQTADVFTRSLDNYGGLTFEWAEIGERWQGFLDLLWYGVASPLLNTMFLVGLPVLLVYGWWQTIADRRPGTGDNFHLCPSTLLPPCSILTDTLLTLFSLTFLLAHVLLSFQVWDRYLLGLIPMLALLLARVLWLPWLILTRIIESRMNFYPKDAEAVRSLPVGQRISSFNFLRVSASLRFNSWRDFISPIYGLALVVLLSITLAQPVQDAVNGRYPLGSHSQALSGIEQIVAYLQGHAGANHTLYHRWLGTHWRFYLWGYPYDLQYWASPQELAAKAKPGHLIAFPSWQSDTEARLALAGVGLELKELTRAYNPAGYPAVVLYEIVSSQ